MGLGLLSDIVYKPGFSFRNSPLSRPITRVRRNPWFYNNFVGGPQTGAAKIRRWRGGNLNRYRAVWKRGLKQAQADKLGFGFIDMPSFEEMELGAIPGPTDTLKSTARNWWGDLTSVLTSGAEAAGQIITGMEKRERERTVEAQGQIQIFERAREAAMTAGRFSAANWPFIVGGLVIGGAVLYSVSK